MLQVNMFSSADKVQGQGVGSAYLELIQLLRKYHSDSIDLSINNYSKTALSHYHTIDLPFYFSTFFRKRFGRRIGYVHFLPSTLKGSIHLPRAIENTFYKYVISFYKRMDHLVVVNPIFIEELKKYGIAENKITYIPNFVAKKDFYAYSSDRKKALREAKGISTEQFVVFGAGQVQERKGVYDFVKLAEEMPDVQFIWAGGFSFGKITDGYEKFKKIMGQPPKNLQFTGIIQRDEMRDYYNMADLFLLPSYEELFPMCILESFASNTPVMLRDLPLYEPVLQGYYLPCADRSDMKHSIDLLKNDQHMYSELKQQAVKGNHYYSEERLAALWLEFYQKQQQESELFQKEN
ncbi:glycosyltransferase family 4 protein [Desemzia sp. RIT804]|uniref:glycosyltransferase family 4 protein n=1 Tax=Desemzia sp. RIT 804 TaxID=2810209 RepID=UPI001951A0F0|nr:glycosyltransferase family 4 protein [Desemzia sp. RIT 804]MBM6613480.1 glycosyltransferase family 4 protein [Desemzia sp. RIT 804]